MYHLFLDDLRLPSSVTWVKDVPKGVNYKDDSSWVIVRSYDEFVDVVKHKGLPGFVSFDHDLISAHYPWNNPDGVPQYDKYTEKTGYEAAKWLCQYRADNNLNPEDFPPCVVHSMNIIGKQNIETYLGLFFKAMWHKSE